MTLYFTDSLGNKKVIAEGILDPVQAVEAIMANQATRFVHSTGIGKIDTHALNHYTFMSKDGQPTGYSLEE